MDILQTLREIGSALLQQEPLLLLVAGALFRLDRHLSACMKETRKVLDQLLSAVISDKSE